MEKKSAMVLVVVIGVILLGVVIAGKQSQDSLLKEVLKRQAEILKAQARIENQLLVPDSGGLSGILSRQQDLERRVAVLENLLRGPQAGGPQQAQRQGPPPEDYTKIYDIPVDHSPVRGNPNAPVTIVAFNDYQCPFSARFHPVILDVLKAYPDKVNFIIKNFPLSFHPQAIPGAKAVLAAGGQGKYFEMADALLADNKDLSEERFKKEAEKLGLNVEKFMKDYKDNDARWQDIIQKDLTLGQNVNVQGTPTFYINGHKSSARDLDSWKKEIDNVLNDPASK
ncbi:MAG TPA: hypothetical protein DD723_01515 [Candidatus Omnitrophica bacterium]|uniref:DSBA oxidoreductase n=1 Tax=Candidatus Magasanikbacteria bacterium GW2011_GWA2_50_22 TaxID=1619043 RepID=A0A0G1ZD19_9BACT|nr:MAG: DSBA oxidoreductase [Candidatus Magasanikbacteria bacterium GW2011_GWA2_50_22]HBR14210.1 hypothetical protein [Candidatus Omnitrophota bacterium]